MSTLVLDNGAYQIKAELSTAASPRMIPNCISKAKHERRKAFIGDQLEECKDYSGIFFVMPFQKGYLVNWDVQRQIWDYVFSKDCLNVDCSETNVICSEPQFNFSSIKECTDEIFFEEYRVPQLCRKAAAELCSFNCDPSLPGCCLVVDCGYSFTHIVPVWEGKVVKEGVRRINVGGKLLTNFLKEVVSYRQLHVLDETYVINQVKEDCCYVSTDFNATMDSCRTKGTGKGIARDYFLPDYANVKRGYLRNEAETGKRYDGPEQVLHLNNEQVTIPEILFHPSDIGIQEMGIAEAIVDCVANQPLIQQPYLYKSIFLCGGCCLFKGLRERVFQDVRSLCPAEFEVHLLPSKQPLSNAWMGGCKYAQSGTGFVTKEQYDEYGKNICAEMFNT